MPCDQSTEPDTPRHASAAPYPVSNSTSSYSTRRKRYFYSHTKPPTIAPPARSTKRPPVPASAARKKSAQKPDAPNVDSQEIRSIGNAPTGPGTSSPDAFEAGSGVSLTQPGTENEVQASQGNRFVHTFLNLPDIPEEQDSDFQPSPSALNDTTEHAEYIHKTPGRHPDIQIVQPTPDRTHTQTIRLSGPSIGISSPSPFASSTSPDWGPEFDDTSILNPVFVPNPSLPLTFPGQTHATNPVAQSSAFSAHGPESPIVQRQLFIEARQPSVTTGTVIDDPPGAPSVLSVAQPSRPDDHLSVPNAIDVLRRSVSPGSFATQVSSNSSGDGTRRPASRALPDLASLHSSIVQGLRPPAPPISRGPSPAPRGPSPAPHGPVPASRGPSPTPPPPTGPSTVDNQSESTGNRSNGQRARRRNDFNSEEYEFIEQMKLRWQWYLLVENAFPLDTVEAQELCTAYAEKMLGIPCSVVGNARLLFCYVRPKDSRIRNDPQNSVLLKVEELYQVTTETKAKVEELIKHSNFLYTGYDPANISRVTGRYRHPCIAAVMQTVLFPPRTRGQTPGVRFIRELITITPSEVLNKYEDKEASYGAPVGLIAFACTLILHALRLIEQGYSSKDEKKKKKLLTMDEARYGNYYRNLVKKIEDYPRLGEVWREHMKHLLAEYQKRNQDGPANGGLDDDDVERYSDGE